MITVKVELPLNTPAKIVDEISVTVTDNYKDRQPRNTYLEGLQKRLRCANTNFHNLMQEEQWKPR